MLNLLKPKSSKASPKTEPPAPQSESAENKRGFTAADLIEGKQTKNKTPLLIMGTLGFQALNTTLLFCLFIAAAMIALKPAPSLVQLVDGHPIRVGATDSTSREPQTIKTFTKDVVALMFSMTGTLPPENYDEARLPKPDPGVNIDTLVNKKIATASFEAGFALTEDFRKPFLESLADITPQELFQPHKDPTKPVTQIVPIIKLISEPQQIQPGLWKVNVVADLILFNQSSGRDQLGKDAIHFNKELTIRAVEPPQKLMGTTVSGTTNLRHSSGRSRNSGD